MVNNSLLNFNSGLRYERIALKGSTSFSINASSIKTITISHNLGYVPYIKSWYTFVDGKYFDLFAGTASFNLDGNSMQIDNSNADTTNFYVVLDNSSAGTISGNIYYRIYAEPQT